MIKNIFLIFFIKAYIVGTHLNCLDKVEAIQTSSHNMFLEVDKSTLAII